MQTQHKNMLREEIKSCFADVDTNLSRESKCWDISSLEYVESFDCEDELAHFQVDSV